MTIEEALSIYKEEGRIICPLLKGNKEVEMQFNMDSLRARQMGERALQFFPMMRDQVANELPEGELREKILAVIDAYIEVI